MCLILFGYEPDADCKLLVAANRDEVHARASAAANYWHDEPAILAGRDLLAGGTWLGCTTRGRFAALTNFSHPDDPEAPLSRGKLVQEFLAGAARSQHYAHHIRGAQYAGFNLLLWDGDELVYTSNRGATDVLKPGFYGLSNAELGARWPKCTVGAARLSSLARTGCTADDLIGLLNDRTTPADDELPHRGKPLELERRVGPCFIVGDEYGTRASAIVEIHAGHLSFTEQSYLAGGIAGGRVSYTCAFQPPRPPA